MESKPWYQSKTILFNLAAILFGTIDQVAGTGILGNHTETVGTVVTIGNVLLRTLTSGAIR